MEGYTNFTNLHAKIINGDSIIGPLTGKASDASKLSGSVISMNTISKAVDYSLSTVEIAKLITSITMTAASKVLTLGLAEGQAMIIYNAGAETVTVKNIATDTGTSLATTKAILVIGSATKDTSIIIALN